MLRQILVVAVGILLSFILAAAAGYFFYSYLSHIFPQEATLGRFARYIVNPAIAFLVGACVGALAKSRPEALAFLSLLPSTARFIFYRHLNLSYTLILMILALVCLLIGMGAARMTFRIRARDALYKHQT
jgi:hypothetical protein